MIHTEEALHKFGEAIRYLPMRLRNAAIRLSDSEKARIEEFRLRAGRGFSVFSCGEEKIIENGIVSVEDIVSVLDLATKSSVHTAQKSIREGFVTVSGGHRIGICGTGIESGGRLSGLRDFSSVSVRIAKSIPTAAKGIAEELMEGDRFNNTLIISPPGHGKTTTLRDLVRRLSDSGKRISLVDERGEVAAKYKGTPQFDVGKCTDVIDGIDKAEGALLMLRAMSPEIIALDEITEESDCDAIFHIMNCGVGILATAHGESAECLFSRPVYNRLQRAGVFKRLVVLKRHGESFEREIRKI
ncbi:MAG: stage III sporulation protein AB [Oscillospiraceae bacterium]|nr:stage III sporulation protein AB [Oscillospiraceae bacterium]MBQ7120038.1 stage III sporulation protein AB [Oscillospiraceae bacterium]